MMVEQEDSSLVFSLPFCPCITDCKPRSFKNEWLIVHQSCAQSRLKNDLFDQNRLTRASTLAVTVRYITVKCQGLTMATKQTEHIA